MVHEQKQCHNETKNEKLILMQIKNGALYKNLACMFFIVLVLFFPIVPLE